MKEDFDIQKIENAFEKIKTDKLFRRSTIHVRILRYLIDQAIAGNELKEQTIGIELLNEDYNDDKNNSKVRVYIYKLRKKLSEYYSDDGKNEELIFLIEKGQYNLTFEKRLFKKKEPPKKTRLNISFPLRNLYLIIGLMITVLIVVFSFPIFKSTYLWKPYLSNNNTLCVIGDKFIVYKKEMGKIHFSLYDDINNLNDYKEVIKGESNLKIKPASFTLTSKMASFGTHYLDAWFHKNKSNFNLKLSSEGQYSDYLTKNTIYIGQYKAMETGKPLFLKNSQVFEPNNDGFSFKSEKGLINYKSDLGKIKSKEYAMVSFQKLDNGNFNLFFVSNHDIGVLATLKMFTSEEKLKEFYKNLPSTETSFNALFEVNGLKRNELSCKLIELEIISSI